MEAVLRSGNHGEIEAWKREMARRRTLDNWPDLAGPGRRMGERGAASITGPAGARQSGLLFLSSLPARPSKKMPMR